MTESKKKRMAGRREMGKCEVKDLCDQHKLDFRMITDYQIRVDNKVDIYPTGKKYFNLRTKDWGQYETMDEILVMVKN